MQSGRSNQVLNFFTMLLGNGEKKRGQAGEEGNSWGLQEKLTESQGKRNFNSDLAVKDLLTLPFLR